MNDSPIASQSHTTWLRVAQITWVILALMFFSLFIAAIPYAYSGNLQICESEVCRFTQLNEEELQLLEVRGISHELYAGFQAASELILLIWVGLGVFIFLRLSDEWIGLVISMALIALGIFGLSDNIGLLIDQVPALTPVFSALNIISAVLLVLLMFLFPDGRFIPRWTRYVAVLLVAIALVDPLLTSVLPSLENIPGTAVGLGAILASITLGAIAQIQRYRNYSTLQQRQQTKWVIFGFLSLLLVATIWSIFFEFSPLPPGPQRLAFNALSFPLLFLLLMALPITMTISILRYRLFEIDVIIKRTVVYGALTIAVIAIYFVAVVILQSAFQALTGQGDQLAIVASTLLIAGLFNPLRRRIQSAVNRRFFRGDYDAAQTLNSFGQSIRDEVDLEHMQAALFSTVEETMQPSALSLWIRETAGATKKYE